MLGTLFNLFVLGEVGISHKSETTILIAQEKVEVGTL